MVKKSSSSISYRLNLLKTNKLSTLIHFITYKCNLNCSFCCIKSQINTSEKREEINNKKLKKIIHSLPLYKKKLDRVILTGGEPFLVNNLIDIILAYNEITDNFSIPTNGKDTNLIIGKIKDILKIDDINLNIGVALDGFKQNHDKLRNCNGLWNKVINTLENLKSINSKYKNLEISAQILISGQNINKLKKLIEYIQIILKLPVELELLRKTIYNDVELKKITSNEKSQLKNLIKTSCNCNVEINPNKRKFYRWAKKKTLFEIEKKIYNCTAGKTIGVLYPTDQVSICEQNPPFANLSDYDFNFTKLWNSKLANQIRGKTNKCSCTHGCFIYNNLYFSICNKLHFLSKLC